MRTLVAADHNNASLIGEWLTRVPLLTGMIFPLVFYVAWNGERWLPSISSMVVLCLLLGLAGLVTTRTATIRAAPLAVTGLVLAGIVWQVMIDVWHGLPAIGWHRACERFGGLAALLLVASSMKSWTRQLMWMSLAASVGILFTVGFTLPDPEGLAIQWFGFGNINMTVHYLCPALAAGAVFLVLRALPRRPALGHPGWKVLYQPATWLILAGIASMVTLSVVTGRRGALAILGTVGLGLVVDWLVQHGKPRVALGLIAGLTFAIIATFYLLTPYDLGPRAVRILQYRAVLALDPGFFGLGTYGIVTMSDSANELCRHFLATRLFVLSAHNEFMDVWLDGGFPALLIAMAAVVAVFLHAHLILHPTRRRVCVALAWSVLPGLLLDNAFSRPEGMFVLGACAGLILRTESRWSTRRTLSKAAIFTGRSLMAVAALAVLALGLGELPGATIATRASLEIQLRTLRRIGNPEQLIMLGKEFSNQTSMQLRADLLCIGAQIVGGKTRYALSAINDLAFVAPFPAAPLTEAERVSWIARCERTRPFSSNARVMVEEFVKAYPRLEAVLPPDVQRRHLAWLGTPVGTVSAESIAGIDDASEITAYLWAAALERRTVKARDWVALEQVFARYYDVPDVCELAFKLYGRAAPPPNMRERISSLLVKAIRYHFPLDLLTTITDADQGRWLYPAMKARFPDYERIARLNLTMPVVRDEEEWMRMLTSVRYFAWMNSGRSDRQQLQRAPAP